MPTFSEMTEEERDAHWKEVGEWWENYKRKIAEGKIRTVVNVRWQLESGFPVTEEERKAWIEWDPSADHRVKDKD